MGGVRVVGGMAAMAAMTAMAATATRAARAARAAMGGMHPLHFGNVFSCSIHKYLRIDIHQVRQRVRDLALPHFVYIHAHMLMYRPVSICSGNGRRKKICQWI